MAETLPVGVGRVPQWWMDITPHYQIEEEDEYIRQAAQDQMDWYYMQLASADEAGLLDADGNPRSDVDWSSWSPTWNGRSSSGGGAYNLTGGKGGRSFKPGQPVIDPKLFGISEMDPDYKSYMTGAKLPPGYFEMMGEMSRHETGGVDGILNNMKQTDYGRYGRQAEKPNFKPAWAKKKLRITNVGANIRQGQYDDSPNKHIRRRVESAPVAPIEEPEPEPEPEPESANPTMTRTVRKIQPRGTGNVTEQKKYEHSDYYNSEPPPVMSEQERSLKEKQEKLKRLQELQRQQQELLRKQQEQQQARHYHNEEEYEEEIIEEEIIEEEEYTEGSYEEEVIEDDDELTDLHAILAAKQAELKRLQAQM